MADNSPDQPIYAGEFRHTVDLKNRVTIPARWRRGETDEFFTVPDLTGSFLMVFPPAELQKVSEMLSNATGVSPRERMIFKRQFYSRAQHCTTDRQGRIVLPEEQCKQVELQNDVVLVGVESRFEIWNPGRWAQVIEEESLTYQNVAGLVGL